MNDLATAEELMAGGRWHEALGLLTELVNGPAPTPAAAAKYIYALALRGHENVLESEAKRMSELFPADDTVSNTYAWSLIILGKPERAQEVYRSVLARSPRSATAIVGLDNSLQLQGKNEEALYLLSEAAGWSSSSALLAALGRAQIVNGRAVEGEATLRNCLDANPKNQDAWLILSTFLWENSRWSEALESAQRAFVPGSNRIDALLISADALQKLGRKAESTNVLEKAAEIQPLDRSVRKRLSKIYLARLRADKLLKLYLNYIKGLRIATKEQFAVVKGRPA